jgi:hypothetical protein
VETDGRRVKTEGQRVRTEGRRVKTEGQRVTIEGRGSRDRKSEGEEQRWVVGVRLGLGERQRES